MRLGAAYGLGRLALRVACAGLRHRPRPQTVAQRLAALPLAGLPIGDPVEIRWNDHLVPFIAARSDRDLATALGLVHAHLRLAQLELLRRIAQGRLGEILGPVAVPLDHALRLIDPTRAVPAMLQALPAATRDWLEGFAAGINHHLARAAEPPLEFRLLGIVAAPWSLEDLLGIARLAAADVNWLLWRRLLDLPRGAEWPAMWQRLVAAGQGPAADPGSGPAASADPFAAIVRGTGHSGSNAFALSGRRSVTGAAWLGGDPHLPLSLPLVWLAAAYRSPSYHVAGLMIPGIPVMAIGRNPWIAWGGANLHAASSELFDVGALPPSEIRERPVRLKVRWSGDREIVLRDTALGPIVSDAPIFATGRGGPPMALRWVGHDPSDELSALLAVNRARDWESFRRAAAGIAVPGQTLVYADARGRIGRLLAAALPRRPQSPPADLMSPPAAAAAWQDRIDGAALPAESDPPCGFVVAANERPPPAPVPIGWFFAPEDRARRLAAMLGGDAALGFPDLARLQRDVAAPAALALRDRLCAAAPPPENGGAVCAAMRAWDGVYAAASPEALAFELVVAHVAAAAIPARRRAVYGTVWHGRRLLESELDGVAPERLRHLVGGALRAAAPAFARWRRWGAAHRLRLAHPLGALPLAGRRYRILDWPWPGSSETLMKAAHAPVTGRHAVRYGSNARYLFDLSRPDHNWLVLLGGQDGVLGSPAFCDQAALFRDGSYVEVPLDPETARRGFRHCTTLQPAQR